MSQYQKTMDDRSVGAFVTKKDKRNYWTILSILLILGVSSAFGLLVYNNPVPVILLRLFLLCLVDLMLVLPCELLLLVRALRLSPFRVLRVIE